MAGRILIVAAEAYPLAKTGGLADAISGLYHALAQAGQELRLLMPAYPGVLSQVRPMAQWQMGGLPGGPARLIDAHCKRTGMGCLLLDNPELFDRTGLYVDDEGEPYPDNAQRFAALAHAAAAVAQGLSGLERPDVVHAHDWHAALVPLLVKVATGGRVKTVLTIHNLAFQGVFDVAQLNSLQLPAHAYQARGLVAQDRINFMLAGITHADRVTTVSEQYAREILTPERGCGLHEALQARGDAFGAIANGIDTSIWSPMKDTHLGRHGFNAEHMVNKAHWKMRLQKDHGLPVDPDALLVTSCCRLTGQKMVDLTIAGLPAALQDHPTLQFVALGRGERRYERALLALAAAHPRRVAVQIGYDEASAHRLLAGADVLWHPSRFEPYGLSPRYAMRYGTLPVATAVGGLVDAIEDPGLLARGQATQRANGLLFDASAPEAMSAALGRALRLYEDTQTWDTMRRNAMAQDHSWTGAVEAYLQLFAALCGRVYQRHPNTALAPGRPPAREPALQAAVL